MILRWALYILLIAFSAYEAIVFSNMIVSMLFVAILMWPVLSMAILLLQRRYLDVAMKIPVPVAEKEGHIQIQIEVVQSTWFPVLQMDARMKCRPLFGGAGEIYPLAFNADGRQSCQFIYEISRDSCGRLRIEINRIRLWDYFHFFSLNKKLNLSEEITFLPQIYETVVTVCEATRHFAGETEDYEPEAAGPDNSQIYQVREYRPGDRLQMIHWKLTARNDELYVRESAEPLCFAVGIFIDFSGKGKNSWESMEAVIETVLSIANGLLEQKCRHFIAWYDQKDDRMLKRKIGKIEDIYEITEYLLSAGIYDQPVDMTAMYKERYPYGLYAVALHVDLAGNIKKEDQWIGSYDRDNVEKSLSELLIQV